MNRQIAEKLRRQGHTFVDPSDETNVNPFDQPFFSWFWEHVLGNSPEEYRRAFWREIHRGHTLGPIPRTFGQPDMQTHFGPYARLLENDLGFRLIFLMVPGSFFWVVYHVIRGVLRKLRRPSYYERERERRLALGLSRRSIRKRQTVNREPTVEEIRAAWNGARHSPEGALRLGGMLEDLECYVNNLTIGNAVEGYRGRRGGIKRHLQDKAPDLFEHYAALMRYKSIARRFRQACGLQDPEPADLLLPMSAPPRAEKKRTNWSEQIKRCQEKASSRARHDVAQDGTAGQTGQAGQSGQAGLTEQMGQAGLTEQMGQAGLTEQMGQAGLTEQKRQSGPKEQRLPREGVKSWILDGFVFAWRSDCWVEREAFEAAVRVLRASENSVISLEAALALEIDPDCVTQQEVKRERKRAGKSLMKVAGKFGPNKSSDLGVDRRMEEELKTREAENLGSVGPNKSSDVGVDRRMEEELKTREVENVGSVGPNKSSEMIGQPSANGQNGNAQNGNAQNRNAQNRNAQNGNMQNGNAQNGNAQNGNAQNGNAKNRNAQMTSRVAEWLKRRICVA